jgi:hypothetical protein
LAPAGTLAARSQIQDENHVPVLRPPDVQYLPSQVEATGQIALSLKENPLCKKGMCRMVSSGLSG